MPDLYEKYGKVTVTLFITAENPKGISFTPVKGVDYRFDYIAIARKMQSGELTMDQIQALLVGDLWFLCYFIICDGSDQINDEKGWFVRQAREVADLLETDTLDLWGRFHGKSLLITIGKSVQYHMKYPDHCTLILSFKKGAAESFQKAIMDVFKNPVMLAAFPMRLYDNPESQAPSWGLEKGATIKRNNKSRKENTIQSSGLVEGMLTGGHFERLLFDDVVTQDTCNNVEGMEKCFKAFEMALNLGTGNDNDIVNIIGTYYHHLDPLTKIKALQFPDGTPVYKERRKTTTDDGTIDGKPVLVSDEYLAKLKLRSDFNTQHLLDPTPEGRRDLSGKMVQDIDRKFIPKGCYSFMMVDPAGDAKDGCDWGIVKVMVQPNRENITLSKVFITNIVAEPMSHAEAIGSIMDMYLQGDFVRQLGIEDDRSTTHIHVQKALQSKGRILSEERNNLVLLKHRGRNKDGRILSAVQWPLVNNCVFISSEVPKSLRDKMRLEMDQFPHGKKDLLDGFAYLWDMIADYNFGSMRRAKREYKSRACNAVTGY